MNYLKKLCILLAVLCAFSAFGATSMAMETPESIPEIESGILEMNKPQGDGGIREAQAPTAGEEASAPAASEEQAQSFHYQHDPRLNPFAMEDIVEDENAVYGFRPAETGSLKQYASIAWDDPEEVAIKRAERLAYHDSFSELYDLSGKMLVQGAEIEEIARAVSMRRNELRIKSYEGDPDGLERMKARNLERYGHEEGALPDEIFAETGSWEAVLEGALSVNSGMDACVGLYDDYYDLYVLMGQIDD